MSHTA